MNYNYHIYNSSIKCPYCDKDCQDEEYTVTQRLETRIEFECEHCGKVFWAEACVVYSTYSDCRLNGDEHLFKNDCAEYPTVFDCENCSQHEVRFDKSSHPEKNA